MNPLLLVFLGIAGLILVLGLALVLFQRRILKDQQAQVKEILEEMQQIAAEERAAGRSSARDEDRTA